MLPMHRDNIYAGDVDEPDELNEWISDKLLHNTEAIRWSLAQELLPGTIGEEEPEDSLTAKGLALGSTGKGKAPLSLCI